MKDEALMVFMVGLPVYTNLIAQNDLGNIVPTELDLEAQIWQDILPCGVIYDIYDTWSFDHWACDRTLRLLIWYTFPLWVPEEEWHDEPTFSQGIDL